MLMMKLIVCLALLQGDLTPRVLQFPDAALPFPALLVNERNGKNLLIFQDQDDQRSAAWRKYRVQQNITATNWEDGIAPDESTALIEKQNEIY